MNAASRRAAATLTAAVLCTSSCVRGDVLTGGVTDKIAQHARVQEACELFRAPRQGAAEDATGFVGDGGQFAERALVGIFGATAKAEADTQRFQPETAVGKRLESLERALKKVAGKKEREAAGQILTAIEGVKGSISAQSESEAPARQATRQLLEAVQQGGVLAEMNRCAREKLAGRRGEAPGGCRVGPLITGIEPGKAIRSYFDVLRPEEGTRAVPEYAAKLRVLAQAIQKHSDVLLGYAELSKPEMLFVVAQMAAYGGVLRDQERAVKQLVEAFESSSATDRAVGVLKVVVDSQSDQVVDLLLYWLGRAVVRLERILARLDEKVAGLATSVVEIAVDRKAVRRGTCHLSARLKDTLVEAGLDEHAFGARVCYASTSNRGSYPSSEIMTSLLGSMVDSVSAEGCDGRAKDERLPEAATARDIARRAQGPALGGMVRRMRGSAEDLARSNWDARLAESQRRLAQLSRPEEITEEVFPVLADLDPMHRAAFLEAELTLGPPTERDDALERYIVVRDEARRTWLEFSSVVVDVGIEKDPWLALPSIYFVGNPDIGKEVRGVSQELCQQRARQDARAAAEVLCSRIEAVQRNGEWTCVPAGYGVSLRTRRLKVGRLEFLSKSKPPENALLRSAQRSVEALARMLDELAGAGALAGVTRVNFIGRASREEIEGKARDELEAALTTSNERRKDLTEKAAKLIEDYKAPEWLKVEDSTTSLAKWISAWQVKDPKSHNELLAVIRALGVLDVVKGEFENVCEGRECQIVPYAAEGPSESDDSDWRSFSITLEIGKELQACDR